MKPETELVMQSVSGYEKYDDACKQAWKLKEVIAPLLQHTVTEYQGYSLADIIGFINADTISEDVPVDDLPAFVEEKSTELSSVTEKRIFFDIHFTAKNPKLPTADILVMLHIDFEVQNDYKPSNPKYPITKRAVYYAARELSSQLNVVTGNTNYGQLEKAYSIWVCNENVPKSMRDSVTRYHIVKENVIGICTEPDEYHDLMEVVIIRRGGDGTSDAVFEYLQGIFSSDLDLIRKYVDVDSNSEAKEAFNSLK